MKYIKKIRKRLRPLKRLAIRLHNNVRFIFFEDIEELKKELYWKIKDDTIEDLFYEFEEDKSLFPTLNIYTADETVDLLLKHPKSFCRLGDGEIGIMRGGNSMFQTYNENLATELKALLTEEYDDMYVGINRCYFQSPVVNSESNHRYYRIYGTNLRRFFLQYCNKKNTYIDAAFPCAYFRFTETYNYAEHYEKRMRLFEGKKIAIMSGEGVLEKLKYDVFQKAIARIQLHGPSKNAYEKIDELINLIETNVPKDYVVCLILGMTASVMVPRLTRLGYMAWDIGHLAKDYDAYMRKTEKTIENIANFWEPD